MHQEQNFPGRVSGTDLFNPDFAALAVAYGVFGATVTEGDQFADTFTNALNSGGPALIHIKVDPDAITPTLSLASMS